MSNPDDKNIVQDHLDWYYRKNARPNSCVNGTTFMGTDLNRNYPMFWGLDLGSSGEPCSPTYCGESPLSEPESSAVFAYSQALFDADMKKGTAEEAAMKINDTCPEDASGIFIDVHSFGDFIYFPWGIEDSLSSNHRALLTMSSKLAFPGNYTL